MFRGTVGEHRTSGVGWLKVLRVRWRGLRRGLRRRPGLRFLVLLTLLVGLVFGWSRGVLEEILRQVVISEGSNFLGADLSVAELRIDVFPPELVVEDLSLRSRQEGFAGQEIVAFKHLGVRLLPSDLTRVIDVSRVELLGLRGHVRLKDGALVDLPAIQALIDKPRDPKPPEPDPTPSRAPKLRLREVALRGASVVVEDEATGLAARVEGLTAVAALGEDFLPSVVLVSARALAFKHGDIDETATDLEIGLRGEGGRYEIERIGVTADGAQVALRGWVGLPPGLLGKTTPAGADPNTSAPMSSAEDPLAFLAGFTGELTVSAAVHLPALGRFLKEPAIAGDARLEAVVRVDGPAVAGEADLHVQDVALTVGETTYVIGSGDIGARGDRSAVEIVSATLTAGGGEVNLSGRLDLEAEGYPVEARVDIDSLQLAQLLSDLGLTGAWVMLDVSGDIGIEGTLDPLALAGDADLDCRELRVYDDSWERREALEPLLAMDLIHLRGPLTIDTEAVTLRGAVLSSGTTRIEADVRFGLDLSLDIGLALTSFDFDDFGKIVGLDLRGHGTGRAVVFGPTSDMVIAAALDLRDARFETYTLGAFRGQILVPLSTLGFLERAREAVAAGTVEALLPGFSLDPDALLRAADDTRRVNDTYYAGRYSRAEELTAMFIQDIEANHGGTDYQGDVNVYFGDTLVLTADADIGVGRLEEVLQMAAVDLGDPPPLTGSITGHVTVGGPLDALDGHTTGLVMTGVEAWGERMERVEADVRLEDSSVYVDRASVLDGDGRIFAAGSLATDGAVALQLSVEGLPLVDIEAVSDADLALTGALGATLTVLGTLDAPVIEGRIEARGVAYGILDMGSLSLDLQTEAETLKVQGALGPWIHLGAQVGLTGALPVRALVQVDDLPLEPFIDLNAAGQRLSSGVAFSVEAAGALGEPAPGAEPAPMRVSARLDDFFVERGPLRIQNFGPSEVDVLDGRIKLRYLHLVGADTDLQLSGTFDPREGLDFNADGTLNAAVIDLFVADTFQRLSGRLTGPEGAMHLNLSGKTDHPILSGVVSVEDLAVRAEAFPQTVDAVHATLRIDDNIATLSDFEGNMGGGLITGGGEMRLDNDLLPYFYNLQFKADEVVLRYPDYLPPSEIHGTLAFQGETATEEEPSSLVMSGLIYVDRSIYRERINWEKDLLDFRTYRLGTIAVVEEEPPLFGFSVAIKANDSIYMRNNVGNLQMSADLMLEGDTNVLGITGDVNVSRGKVYLLNNELDVVSGKVNFPDHREFNPWLDITLQTEIETYTIRYQILGTWEEYQILSSSDAGLSERDINSLLAFGVLADELQSSNASVVAQPALEFLAGSLGLQEQIEGVVPFELDRFGITPVVSDSGSTSVRFYGEKEIKEDKLSTSFHYDVGVQQDYQFTLEYQIGDTLSVVGDADQGRQVNSRRVPNFGARFKLKWEWQ